MRFVPVLAEITDEREAEMVDLTNIYFPPSVASNYSNTLSSLHLLVPSPQLKRSENGSHSHHRLC